MPYASGPGGQIVAEPSQTGGLFGALFDPDVQAQRLANQQRQIQLNQETAFQGGLPTTDGTPNGPIDLNAVARTQMQNGDINGGMGLLSAALKMQLLRDPASLDDPTGRGSGGAYGGAAPANGGYGGGQVGQGGQGAQGGFVPAAGGGMIAPAAGGDRYGRTAPTGISATGATAGSGSGIDQMDIYAHSIGAQESGNNYNALGPKTQSGDRAYGRFQVMGSNIGPWTQQVLGQAMSPQDFLANPQAQDAVFKAKFGQSLQQYNNPADAASVWFSGRPMARAGNSADQLGTTVPAYVSKFLAGLGPASQALQGGQGGQGNPYAAPPANAGGPPAPQAQPISFGGGPAQPPAAPSGGASDGMPIGDQAVMDARNRLTAAQDLDPSQLSVAQQKQLTADTGTLATYTAQQNTPARPGPGASAGTVNGAPTGTPSPTITATDDTPSSAHPFGPGSTALKEPRAPLPGASPAGGAAPAGAPPPQGGGLQPISFAGSAGPGPQGGGAPGAVPPPAGATMPADVSAAIGRLRSNQGSPADSVLWGSYLKSQQGGGAGAGGPQMVPGGAALPSSGGSPGSTPTGAGGPARVPATPSVTSASTPQQSGPDVPGLPASYQDPGGGARYVNDIMNRASRFLEGDPRIAIWENKAKQVQAQLDASQTFKNNLALAQARADDRYNAANSQGAIDAAGAKAGSEATARNKLTLVPSVQSDGSTIMIPQSDAVTAANNGKPIVSQQPGYVTQGQSNLLSKLNDGSAAYQERQVSSQRLDALSSLLENYQTGANSTAFNNAVADLRSLNISVPNSATANPGAMQEFTKNAYANVLASMREQGNKQYAAEVQGAINSNPNPDLQPEANAAMIGQMQGTKRWYDQNYRDYSTWYHGNKGAADDADFQTGWVDKHPLGAYVSAAEKDIAPVGLSTPSSDKLVDGQAYQSQGVKKRWSASANGFVPFTGPTAPALGGGSGGSSSSGAAPAPGARQASDGQWYVDDPSRPGKWLMVVTR